MLNLEDILLKIIKSNPTVMPLMKLKQILISGICPKNNRAVFPEAHKTQGCLAPRKLLM